MATWFMTFPQRLSTRNCYRRIEGAASIDVARRAACRHHGTAWAFVYPIAELAEARQRFGLVEILPAIDVEQDRG